MRSSYRFHRERHGWKALVSELWTAWVNPVNNRFRPMFRMLSPWLDVPLSAQSLLEFTVRYESALSWVRLVGRDIYGVWEKGCVNRLVHTTRVCWFLSGQRLSLVPSGGWLTSPASSGCSEDFRGGSNCEAKLAGGRCMVVWVHRGFTK